MTSEEPLYRIEEDEDVASGRRSAEHWTLLVLSTIAVLGLLLFPAFLSPDERGYGTHEQLGFQPCYPLAEWNVPCPGCGVTTAVTHATHGNLVASLRAQPFGLVLVVASIAAFVFLLSEHLRGRDAWHRIALWSWPRLLQGLLVVMALAWLYKIGAVRGWF